MISCSAYEVSISYTPNTLHSQRNVYTRFKRSVQRVDSVPSTLATTKNKAAAVVLALPPNAVIAIDSDDDADEPYSEEFEEFEESDEEAEVVVPVPVKAKKAKAPAAAFQAPLAPAASATPVWEFYDKTKSQWTSLPPALTKMVEGIAKRSAIFPINVPGVGGFQVNLTDMSMKSTTPENSTTIRRTPALTSTSASPALPDPVVPASPSTKSSKPASKKKKIAEVVEEEAFEADPELVARCKKATGWKSLTSTKDKAKLTDSKCVICYDDFADARRVVHLSKCGAHYFHESCIAASFKPGFVSCPVCQTIYGVRVGTQPKGTMRVNTNNSPLPGFEKYGTITISYNFPDGTQGAQHPSPGEPYYGTSRSAYLPDSPEGRKVLKLLQLAFDRALVFTIGTSVTTGATDSVIWNGIHHKTSTHGGSSNFGYPDETYLERVTDELSAKGVALD